MDLLHKVRLLGAREQKYFTLYIDESGMIRSYSHILYVIVWHKLRSGIQNISDVIYLVIEIVYYRNNESI